MGVGHRGLVRLRGLGKEGAGSQPRTDCWMEKKEREESEGERNEGEGGEEKKRKETGETKTDKDG